MSQQDVEVTDAEEALDDAEGGQDAEESGSDQLSDLELEGDIAADYIEGLLDIADLDGDIDMDVEGDRAIVSVVGATLDELVGDDGVVLEALQELTRLYGRAHTEHIICGPGLVNVARFTSQGRSYVFRETEDLTQLPFLTVIATPKYAA